MKIELAVQTMHMYQKWTSMHQVSVAYLELAKRYKELEAERQAIRPDGGDMSPREYEYIFQELRKRFPDLELHDPDEGGACQTYVKCSHVWRLLNRDPESWKLVQEIDADTMQSKWKWVKKS